MLAALDGVDEAVVIGVTSPARRRGNRPGGGGVREGASTISVSRRGAGRNSPITKCRAASSSWTPSRAHRAARSIERRCSRWEPRRIPAWPMADPAGGWRPSPFLTASAGLHGVALATLLASPQLLGPRPDRGTRESSRDRRRRNAPAMRLARTQHHAPPRCPCPRRTRGADVRRWAGPRGHAGGAGPARDGGRTGDVLLCRSTRRGVSRSWWPRFALGATAWRTTRTATRTASLFGGPTDSGGRSSGPRKPSSDQVVAGRASSARRPAFRTRGSRQCSRQPACPSSPGPAEASTR